MKRGSGIGHVVAEMRISNNRAIVEPGRDDALIGAIVLEDLDLLVDCSQQMLRLRDPEKMLAFVE